MAWNPTQNVVDLTPVIGNLLAYVEANQQDALEWAHGSSGIDPFAAIYPNAAGWLRSLYPYLMVVTHQDRGEDAETENGDVIVTTFTLLFEVAVKGNADELPTLTKEYDRALRSMLGAYAAREGSRAYSLEP